MKALQSNKLAKTVLFVVILVPLAGPALAYPPDNAAVLYYKAFMLYRLDDGINMSLWDYWKGNIEVNEEIEQYLKKNRRIIETLLDATEIDHCDWGLDYSRGTEVLLPNHQKTRELFVLLAVDARRQADRGDYKTALSRCMSIYKMARHLNERPIITYLVSTAINAAANRCMTQILSEMPQDTATLTWLRDELAEFDRRPCSIEPALRWKREAAVISMSPDRINDVVESGLDDGALKQKALERIRTADKQFFSRNIDYWNDYMDGVQAAFHLPYVEAYARLRQLDKGLSEAFEKNPDATLTACLAPGFSKIHAISVRLGTGSNALRAAVEIYLTKATTGSLPETLPAGLPTDLFSGKPFQYSKSSDGFVLRCRGKDLTKETIYDYEFKVKK